MGSVYFVRCRNLIKIGYAEDVAYRLMQLQTGNPFGLELAAVVPGASMHTERMFHDHFKAYRSRGEWFTYNKELKRLIQNVQAGAVPLTKEALTYYCQLKKTCPRKPRLLRTPEQIAAGKAFAAARIAARLQGKN